jgi:hypothetical protein
VFQSQGFPVVDAATVRQNLQKDELRNILEGDNQAAILLGQRTGADVVVAGTVQESSERRQAPSTNAVTDFFRVRLSARAVNVASSALLGEAALTQEVPSSEDAARQQVADSAGADLSAKILRGWKPQSNITQIYAENADYQRVQLLKSMIMRDVSGVTSVVTRDLVGRTAVVEVVSEVPTQDVLVQIDRCVTAIPFVVTGSSGNRIDIRFGDTPGQCLPEHE